jgi:hypothetical protein
MQQDNGPEPSSRRGSNPYRAGRIDRRDTDNPATERQARAQRAGIVEECAGPTLGCA